MSGFISRSSRALLLVGVAGAISTAAISGASAFGGSYFGGGGMMHPMGGGGGWAHPSMGHFPVSTPSWIGGGNHPSGGKNCGYGGGCGGVWGQHPSQVKLPPWWGTHPWQPGGSTGIHCGWGSGCGTRPWHPGFPWHPGYPWHPSYPIVYQAPVYTTPTYTAPTYTAPTYTAPTYTAPVTYHAPAPAYTAPAAYTAPVVTTPAVATSTCPVPDFNQQYVSVTFQSNASGADTATFLKAYNVVVQDGPNQDGSFRLRLQSAVPQDQMGQLIDSMKSQTAIVSQAAAS